jgi:hypothetical protein
VLSKSIDILQELDAASESACGASCAYTDQELPQGHDSMARRLGRFGSSKIASKMLCQIALGAKMNGSSEGATKTS